MITLYQFPRIDNIPNISPFCMKLESYLRAMETPYKAVKTFDPRKSPTGKMPYIEMDNKIYADSSLIISMLEKTAPIPMQSSLNTAEKAVSLAFIRMMDEHLYWAILYSRWIDEKGASIWAEKLQVAMNMPKLAFKLIFSGIRKNIEKSLEGHGIGRHKEEDIYALAQHDIRGLADFLGGRDFCFGSKPTLMDHCLYAYIGSIISVSWDYPLKEFTLKCMNLVDHYHRMMELFYSDLSDRENETLDKLEVNS